MSDFDGSNRRQEGTAAATARTAQDKAAQGAGLVGDKGTEVVGTAREQAAQVTGEATAQAKNLANDVREQLQDQARTQTQRLAQNVRRLADELQDIRDKGGSDSTAAGVVGQIADSGHQVASHLERRGPDGLVSDLRDYARQRPGIFLAGAALAGFAAARAGKGFKAAGGDDDSGRPPARGRSVGEGRGRGAGPPGPDTPGAPGWVDGAGALTDRGPSVSRSSPTTPYRTGDGAAPGPVVADDLRPDPERPQGS
ncbi:hypothetical protein ACPXCE_28105 [Streptomyces sp. DT24]|uniref:hypothetical protein n=1 Tax=Streptomyces sp. DT24 TaxID=3416520 RepID=UPI003CF1E629